MSVVSRKDKKPKEISELTKRQELKSKVKTHKDILGMYLMMDLQKVEEIDIV